MADDDKKRVLPFGVAIAFGLLVGAAVGMLLLDNLVLGAAVGLALGIILPMVFGSATKK